MDVALVFFFFFQAEDGIRDFHVTGVQTCALPISSSCALSSFSLAIRGHEPRCTRTHQSGVAETYVLASLTEDHRSTPSLDTPWTSLSWPLPDAAPGSSRAGIARHAFIPGTTRWSGLS